MTDYPFSPEQISKRQQFAELVRRVQDGEPMSDELIEWINNLAGYIYQKQFRVEWSKQSADSDDFLQNAWLKFLNVLPRLRTDDITAFDYVGFCFENMGRMQKRTAANEKHCKMFLMGQTAKKKPPFVKVERKKRTAPPTCKYEPKTKEKRELKRYEYQGQSYTVFDLCRMFDICEGAVYARLRKFNGDLGAGFFNYVRPPGRERLILNFAGRDWTIKELAEFVGVTEIVVHGRLFRNGRDVEKALSKLFADYNITPPQNPNTLHQQC